MKTKLMCLGAAFLLAGCATSPAPVETKADEKKDVDALEEFERLSVEMIHEMRLWAKAKEARNRDVLSDKQIQQRFFQSTHIPEGFNKKVTFKFYGTAIKAVEAIAMSAGYNFEVENRQARQGDPTVDIRIENSKLVEALYEVGLATGDAVSIEVLEASASGESKKIIYRYNE